METTTNSTTTVPSCDWAAMNEFAAKTREFEQKHGPLINAMFLSEPMLATIKKMSKVVSAGRPEDISNALTVFGIEIHMVADPFERKLKAFELAWLHGKTAMYEDEDGNLMQVNAQPPFPNSSLVVPRILLKP